MLLSESKTVATLRLALVGQPNVGKSVLFQALTGRYVTVSNYPGTTVEIARGVGDLGERAWQVVDTPGIRSLLPRSEDEVVTRNQLLEEPPDVLVQVADAKDLRRALRLTLELARLGRPMVLVLNLADEARARGLGVSTEKLTAALGFPVVETVAVTGEGVSDLRRAIGLALPYGGPAAGPPEVARALHAALRRLPSSCPSPDVVAEMLLAAEPTMDRWLRRRFNGAGAVDLADLRRPFLHEPEILLASSRRMLADEIASRASWRSGGRAPAWLDRLGMALLRPVPGILSAAVVLWALYEFVGVFAAKTAVDFLENIVFGAWLLPPVIAAFDALLPAGWFRDLWVGDMGLITMGLTYALAIILPVVTSFFLFFSVLEDSGYLPRLSVLLDRLFRPLGLNGKAVFPMILGLGCGTMATLTTRVLDSRRERLLVTLLIALAVPCSAQLGVVMGLLAGISASGAAVWLGAILGTFFIIGWAAGRLVPGARVPFWLEIPPLRMPRADNILLKTKARVYWYLREAVPYFLAGTLAMFILDRTGGLRALEKALSPLVTGWLGLPREATFALVSGFLKRDYGAAGFYALARKGLLSPEQIVVSLVTLTLFLPCLAQFLIMIKERGGKTAFAVAALVTAVALGVGGATRVFLSAIGGLP
jgi:ferrous iron transport protein B